MHNVYQTNRTFCQSYKANLLELYSKEIRPEEFTPAEDIDSQKFYLEFKTRLLRLVQKESDRLREQLQSDSNSHLILLKYSSLVDTAIQISFQTAIWFYNKQNGQTLDKANAPIVIIARGGYGREELFFHSDIDVQIYSKAPDPGFPSECITQILKYFEYLFIHQEIFPASRHFNHTPLNSEGPEFDKNDPSEFCSLMEHRYIAGNKLIYNEFKSAINTVTLLNQEEIIAYCKTHKTYFEIQNTVFAQEPNIKEEIRRLYWALILVKIRHKLKNRNLFEILHELFQKGMLSEAVFKKMQTALNFEVRARLFLHCHQRGAHSDVLSYEVRDQIAEAMQFEVQTFFKEYYYNVVYPLKRYSRNLFWGALSDDTQKTKTLTEHFGLNSEKQIIFIKKEISILADRPETIFQILGWVAKDNYHLSFSVIREIEQNLYRISPVFLTESQNQEIRDRFHGIIKGKYFAKALRLLHEFSLLQNYCIPEFQKLCGLLQDIYVHKFPTDIHILAALDKLNDLELNRNADKFLVELYQSVKDKTGLKLAVLLHDIGKGFKEPGQNEELVGAGMVSSILKNLQFENQKRIEMVAFLVERHLTMRDLMLLDPEEHETYERVWDLVCHDKERLKTLILLTYADRGGTKMSMSPSEIEQLKNFYQYTLYHKKRRQVSAAVKLEFLKMVSLPRDIQLQLEVYNEFLHSGDRFSLEMMYRPGQPSDLIVCAPDAIGLLHKIATVLFFNRGNISQAQIHTERGNVLDLFKVYNSEDLSIDFSNFFFLQKQIKKDLRRVLVDGENLSSVYKGKIITNKSSGVKFRTRKPKIKIIGRSVSIETPDTLGTFMMETKVFFDMKMEIHRAVLHTQSDSSSNVFYLRPEDVNRILKDESRFRNTLTEALSFLQNHKSLLFEDAYSVL